MLSDVIRYFSGICPGLLLATAVVAETVDHHDTLEEIVVTADPLGEIGDHLVQPVQILGREELASRSRRNIGEMVANEPGVTSSDFGAAVGRPIIRGLGGSRVSVLENGISSMDAASISVDHGVPVESLFANQVEIFRGPATLLFGSGASGGVVNVVNDRILREKPAVVDGEMTVQYESVSDGITGGGSVNTAAGDFALHLDGMVRNMNDYDIPGFAELEPDEPGKGTLENSSIETENVAGGLSWISDRGFIGLSVGRLWNDYGVPGAHHEETGGATVADGTRIVLDQTRYDFEAAVEDPLGGIHRIRTRWGINDYTHREVEANGETATTFDNDEVEGRLEIIHDTAGTWDGVIGLQYRDKDFAAVGEESFVLPARLESVAVFLLEKGDFCNWHVDLGARYEWQDTETETGLEADHGVYSLSAGLDWDFMPGFHLGLALTHAQRAPSIEELYADGPHLATSSFEIGNPGLEKEKSSNLDLYLQKSSGGFTFTANFFYNRIDNFVFLQEQDLNGDGVADRVEEDFDGSPADILPAGDDDELLLVVQTQQDADFFGFELEGIYRLLDDERGFLDLRLWADYVQAERGNDVNLPRITPWRFGTGLKYERGALKTSLDYTRINRQKNNAPLETETRGHDLLSIHGSYAFSLAGNELNVSVTGSNLFNEEIRRHTSFVKDIAPLPGRSITVGLNFIF